MLKRWFYCFGLLLLLVIACTPETHVNHPSLTPSPTSTSTVVFTPEPTQTLPITAPLSYTPTLTLSPTPEPSFSFIVTSDMSYTGAPEYINYPNFFAALLEFVKQIEPGDFMVSPGDVLPAADTRWTIDQVLGEDYLWFPMPGNHDFSSADIKYLQNYNFDPDSESEPNIVNWGPEPCPRTTYSFDYQNAHFVALNVYCNKDSPWGIDGNITDTIYDWLSADLAETEKEHIFVFGHEPAFPQPDAQTGHVRHLYESLDQYPKERDRFWRLLQTQQVVAYIHGHTHGYSATLIEGVWQIDAGHAMGVRAAPTPGTFLIITVEGGRVILSTYRGEEAPGFSFSLWEEIQLAP